jgi:hypothetical protein
MRFRFLSVALAMCGCAATRAERRADGSYTIHCNSQKACLDRAARLCADSGYDIIGGRHDQKVYGVPGNQKVVGRNELYVRCRRDALVDAPDPALGSWKLERADAGPAKTNRARATRFICRPGETQRCIGRGACKGGQACKTDGSGFGACDCGQPKAAVAQQHPATDGGVPQ